MYCGGCGMAARKRASSRSSRSGLVGRAVTAGRKALRDAERRVPRDVRPPLQRPVKDGQKTLKIAPHPLQAPAPPAPQHAHPEKTLNPPHTPTTPNPHHTTQPTPPP